jgi:hypothetical protein
LVEKDDLDDRIANEEDDNVLILISPVMMDGMFTVAKKLQPFSPPDETYFPSSVFSASGGSMSFNRPKKSRPVRVRARSVKKKTGLDGSAR